MTNELGTTLQDIEDKAKYKQAALDALEELYGQALEFHGINTTIFYEIIKTELEKQ